MINARRSDLDKLDEFTKRLDNINELLNQVQQGLYPLKGTPPLSGLSKKRLSEIS
jgi:hypothetical protein